MQAIRELYQREAKRGNVGHIAGFWFGLCAFVAWGYYIAPPQDGSDTISVDPQILGTARVWRASQLSYEYQRGDLLMRVYPVGPTFTTRIDSVSDASITPDPYYLLRPSSPGEVKVWRRVYPPLYEVQSVKADRLPVAGHRFDVHIVPFAAPQP